MSRERVHIRRFYSWLAEKLWVQPALYSIGAIIAVSVCTLADYLPIAKILPDIKADLIETLMSVLTASMLGVATFAVASMVSAYASVGTNATPRAFALVIADDVSKRALSSFIGAFIFGTIGIIAMNLKFYDLPGRFFLFGVTLLYYAWVIWIFMRWVDSIARLGRMGNAIARVEAAAANSLATHARAPLLGAARQSSDFDQSRPVYPAKIGYIEDIDMSDLQEAAEECGGKVHVAATPGSFVGPGRPVAYIEGGAAVFNDGKVSAAFYIGKQRWFSSDPRFGLVVLAQIASRALSPGINDPGTAIDVLGSATRLLVDWSKKLENENRTRAEDGSVPEFPDVSFPELPISGLLNDAFTAIARDGAAQVEVMIRLQRDLQLLAASTDGDLRDAALEFSKSALERTRLSIAYESDEEAVAEAAAGVERIVMENRDNVDDAE